MAAQERAKAPAAPASIPASGVPSTQVLPQTTNTTAPTATFSTTTATDTSSSFDFMNPPPAFDPQTLPPLKQQQSQQQQKEIPPPAFDVYSLPPPSNEPGHSASLMWDPMAPAPPPTQEENWTPQPPAPSAPPSAPSAPPFEDLLGFDTAQPLPPPQVQTFHEESSGGLDDEAMQAILAIEGLSMEEKQAMIDEQKRILASIEKEKKSSQVNAADAFVQRSHAAAVQAIGGTGTSSRQQTRTVDIGNGTEVALKGQEQTQKAIQDGTAVLAQCLSCENWMQVTGSATLMFCPTCQTVSPVLKADDSEAAAQLKADMELAQRLQNEEYSAAEQREERQRHVKKKTTESKSSAAASSWWDYLGFGSNATAATGVAAPAPSFAMKPPERGEMGVSRPPGSSRRLEPVQTGEESFGMAPSYEENGPLLHSSGSGAAVVAQRQSLFACVGDSISSAATSLTNALAQDEEGNVHGVDSSGLLAVTQVGRGTQYQNMDDRRI